MLAISWPLNDVGSQSLPYSVNFSPMAGNVSLGIAYINDPESESGVLYTKPEGEGSSAPRDIGTYEVTKRYTVMGVPMMSVSVKFDTGHAGYGKLRADGPGFVDVFGYKAQPVP